MARRSLGATVAMDQLGDSANTYRTGAPWPHSPHDAARSRRQRDLALAAARELQFRR